VLSGSQTARSASVPMATSRTRRVGEEVRGHEGAVSARYVEKHAT
jgi:hypothetical protein